MERWRSIPGFSCFEASDLGRIRRVSYPLFSRGPRYPLPHVLRGWITRTGYWNVNIPRDGETYRGGVRVHRLVLLAFHGEPKEGQTHGCHIDGDKRNNRADNLYWGDHRTNGADTRKHETFAERWKGDRHPTAKLTEENVRWIKRRLMAGETIRSIAESHGVSESAIAMISAGRNWAWVDAA